MRHLAFKDANGKELKATKLVGGLGLTSGDKKPFIRTKVSDKDGINKVAAWAQDCQKLADIEHAGAFHHVDANFRSVYSEIRSIGFKTHNFRELVRDWKNGSGKYEWVEVGTIKTGTKAPTKMEIKFVLKNNILRIRFRYKNLAPISIPHGVNSDYIGGFAIMYDSTECLDSTPAVDVWCKNVNDRFPEMALWATAACDTCGLIAH